VTQFDSRFTLRALRSISSLRKHITADILSQVVATTYPYGNETAAILLKAIGLDQRKAQEVMKTGEKLSVSKEPIPEVDIYLGILVQVCH
jgi:26S proteasome regulatory subunit N3